MKYPRPYDLVIYFYAKQIPLCEYFLLDIGNYIQSSTIQCNSTNYKVQLMHK